MRLGFLLLLLAGCHVKQAVPVAPDPIVVEAASFVDQVNKNMPVWDADVDFAKYEVAEIAQVKADIVTARRADRQWHFLEDVAKLHEDWDALNALDELLHKSYVV